MSQLLWDALNVSDIAKAKSWLDNHLSEINQLHNEISFVERMLQKNAPTEFIHYVVTKKELNWDVQGKQLTPWQAIFRCSQKEIIKTVVTQEDLLFHHNQLAYDEVLAQIIADMTIMNDSSDLLKIKEANKRLTNNESTILSLVRNATILYAIKEDRREIMEALDTSKVSFVEPIKLDNEEVMLDTLITEDKVNIQAWRAEHLKKASHLKPSFFKRKNEDASRPENLKKITLMHR